MNDLIEDLYTRWQGNPDDAAETAALCEALRGARRPDLVEIVGSHASRLLDVGALLAAARMYTDSGRLDDAQAVLLSAGRIAPREGAIYRWLGDVLLRRGDAERAEKVLEKAVQFGADSTADSLLDRARALIPTQHQAGPGAVAEAVARTSPAYPPSGPLPPSSERDLARPVLAQLNVPERWPQPSESDIETSVRENAPMAAAIEAALAQAGAIESEKSILPPVRPPPFVAPGSAPAPSGSTKSALQDIVFPIPTRGLGFDIPQSNRNLGRAGPDDITKVGIDPKAAFQTGAVGAPSDRVEVANAFASPRTPPLASLPLSGALPFAATERVAYAAPRSENGYRRPASPQVGGAVVPEPRDVLDALQAAGVYEPHGQIDIQNEVWAKPKRSFNWFGSFTLTFLAIVLVCGGVGTFRYVRKVRALEHLDAEKLLIAIDKQLEASDERMLDPTEKAIGHAFELESRSPHAAVTWLHERVLLGLLKGGADLAFEDSVQRAKAVGIEEKWIAFAHIASFLYQGDTAGAAATVAKWDSVAFDDPWFQLMAGATFERAGDARSLERYTAALRIDPELVIAQALLTRATFIEGDPRHAFELAKDFRTRYPERPEGAALIALAWARDPLRGEPPTEVKELTDKDLPLPLALRAVPHACRAILALHRGALDEAKPSLQKGLDAADSPGVATWLGSVALATGDEALARRAALAAVSYSAVYPPARVLAARVALLAGRLDEALKATEELPAAWADVAVVAAAASYEKLDLERIGRAFEAVPEDGRKQIFVIPLARGQALLSGNTNLLNSKQALDMADDEAPWADLVAMDWALDIGDVDLAKKIADHWKGETRALRAVRLARMHRYDGKLEEADKYSRAALEGGTVTMRALSERVFTLVAMKHDADAVALFKAYPNVGGSVSKWLRAYATAAHGKVDDARAMVSGEDPPPAGAPMPARIIAATAYGMMKDSKHGGEYLRPIVFAGFTNPDVSAASEKLGLGKITRRPR